MQQLEFQTSNTKYVRNVPLTRFEVVIASLDLHPGDQAHPSWQQAVELMVEGRYGGQGAALPTASRPLRAAHRPQIRSFFFDLFAGLLREPNKIRLA